MVRTGLIPEEIARRRTGITEAIAVGPRAEVLIPVVPRRAAAEDTAAERHPAAARMEAIPVDRTAEEIPAADTTTTKNSFHLVSPLTSLTVRRFRKEPPVSSATTREGQEERGRKFRLVAPSPRRTNWRLYSVITRV